jgi:hypothetical protein
MAKVKVNQPSKNKKTPKKKSPTKDVKEKYIVPKGHKLSPRQEFHQFYHNVYLEGANELIASGEPHHADKHGQLGYENNTIMVELQTATGKPELVPVKGLCVNCTIDRPSAEEEYANN